LTVWSRIGWITVLLKEDRWGIIQGDQKRFVDKILAKEKKKTHVEVQKSKGASLSLSLSLSLFLCFFFMVVWLIVVCCLLLIFLSQPALPQHTTDPSCPTIAANAP